MSELSKRVEAALEQHAPVGFDPASDDMTVQFAIKLAEQDAEIERLKPYVDAFRREETRADAAGTQIDDLSDGLSALREAHDATVKMRDEAEAEIERLRTALTKAHYLAQAARRAMRDRGGAEKFLDLNASVAEFQKAYDAAIGDEQLSTKLEPGMDAKIEDCGQ